MAVGKKQLYFIVPFLMFLGVVIMLGLRLGKSSEIKTDTASGKPLPAFLLPVLSDTSQTMSKADLPKSPYLLNVWGSWCPTCRAEHPFLMQLHAQNVPIVGVNYKDELEDALGYLRKYGDPFMYSLQDYSGNLAIDLGLTGAPESFVVDKNGVVRMHILGELSSSNWQGGIASCLAALNGDDVVAQNAACVLK